MLPGILWRCLDVLHCELYWLVEMRYRYAIALNVDEAVIYREMRLWLLGVRGLRLLARSGSLDISGLVCEEAIISGNLEKSSRSITVCWLLLLLR